MAWKMFKLSPRPKLDQTNTGHLTLERSYGVPPTSIFGAGGIPVGMSFDKLAPGIFLPTAAALPVSIGGATAQTYQGSDLEPVSAGTGMI